MKKLKALFSTLCFTVMVVNPLIAHPLSALECEALEYAIDDATTSGQHTLANVLFGIYDSGGCWPY